MTYVINSCDPLRLHSIILLVVILLVAAVVVVYTRFSILSITEVIGWICDIKR